MELNSSSKLAIHRPSYPLSEFVSLIWTYEGYQPDHVKEKILANIYSEINIEYTEKPYEISYDSSTKGKSISNSIISGVKTRAFYVDTSKRSNLLSIVFRPGALYSLFQIPSYHFSDVHTPITEVFEDKFNPLLEKIYISTSHAQKVAAIEDFLFAKIKKVETIDDWIMPAIHKIQLGRPIKQIVEGLGISYPTFISRFKESVGVSPKLFSRVVRFTKTIENWEKPGIGNPLEWYPDYYDQSHFIKEFKRFSGIKPTSYSPQDPRHGFNIADF